MVQNALVEGYDVYEKTQLLGLYTPIDTILANLLEECYFELGDTIQAQASFGRLVGSDNGTSLWLPILTDTLLPQSNCYRFEENFDQKTLEAVVYSTLTESRQCWTVHGSGEKSILEFHYPGQNVFGIWIPDENCFKQGNGSPKAPQNVTNYQIDEISHASSETVPPYIHYIQLCRLGKLTWFLPKSEIHVQITCTSQKRVRCPSTGSQGTCPVIACKRRKITCWDFHPQNGLGPSWTLALSEAEQVENTSPYAPLNSQRFFCINLRPHWPLQKPKDYNSFSNIQLHELIERISFEFLIHCRDIALRLDAELSKTLETYFMQRELFYPGYFGDVISEARRHYDVKKIKSAKHSVIEALRRLNNEVKRALIEKYVKEQSSILDLACGHGQDMLKYVQRHITHYVGIDISKEEIKEALRRLEKFQKDSGNCPSISCIWKYFQGNLLEESSLNSITGMTFNTVSIQLAIHYLMSSEHTAHSFLKRVASHLESNGYFLGSTGYTLFIAERLAQLILGKADSTEASNVNYVPHGPFVIGNSMYRIEIAGDSLNAIWTTELSRIVSRIAQLKDSEVSYRHSSAYKKQVDYFKRLLRKKLLSTWGIKYNFWLKDHIDAAEYIVPWDGFCELAAQYGLRLVEYKPFDQFLAHEEMTNTRLHQWVKNHLTQIPINEEELEVFQFYCIFVFTKDLKTVQDLPNGDPKISLTNPHDELLESSSSSSTSSPMSETTTSKLQHSPTRNPVISVPEPNQPCNNAKKASVKQQEIDTVPHSIGKKIAEHDSVLDSGLKPSDMSSDNDDDTWSASPSALSSISSSLGSSSSSSTSSFPNFKPLQKK